MKILVVGFSNIAQRKVLPALETLGFEGVEIATGRPEAVKSVDSNTPVTVYSGYEEGIIATLADLCYISTVNSAHYHLAKLALENGMHVVIDKPSVMHAWQGRELVNLARQKGLLLAESVVYSSHARFRNVLRRLDDLELIPRHITATFCFPPVAPDSYRYKAELGGGALYDLGAYIITPGRYIFGEEPKDIVCWKTEDYDGLEVGLRVMFKYSDSRTFSGYYGFDAEYQNQIRIAGKDFYVDMDRFFATPGNMDTEAIYRHKNEFETWQYAGSDGFAYFFQEIIKAIKNKDLRRFDDDLLMNLDMMDRLRIAWA